MVAVVVVVRYYIVLRVGEEGLRHVCIESVG